MKMSIKSSSFGLGILLGLSLLLIYITNKFILSVDFYNNNGNIFAIIPSQNTSVYDTLQKWIYTCEVIYELVKIIVVTFILYTALYLFDHFVAFGKILNVVIFCEYIFLIPAALKIFFFLSDHPHGQLNDWHRTYVFSALSLVGDVGADWYYPLQTLNVFEVAYWFLLAYGIYKITKTSYDTCLKVVVCSYLPALLIWVALVSFCTILIFPNNG